MTMLRPRTTIAILLLACSTAMAQQSPKERIRMDGGPVRVDEELPGPRQAPASAPAEVHQRIIDAVTTSPLVFSATVEGVEHGPMSMSEPPILTMSVTFKEPTMLKGDKPAELTFAYRVTRGRGIEPEVGQKLIVAAEKPAAAPPADGEARPAPGPAIRRPLLPLGGRGGPAIRLLAEASDDNLAAARTAAKLPAGWTLNKDSKPVSPWAELGDKAWPKDAAFKPNVEITCAATGRPALLAGPGIQLKIEQIIPANVEQYKNPFGDGKFKISVTNAGEQAVDVPALLTSNGKDILWADSVIVINADKPRLLPGAGGLAGTVKPVRLAPGQTVSAELDTLKLAGISWPRGGSRVYFRFALGELVQENFFYYFSDRHDRMRGQGPAVKDDPAGNQAGWIKLFADEQWYKTQQSGEREFAGTLVAVPDADAPSTLMRTSYYRLGDRTIYTGAKRVAALDKLVGKRVVIRGKPYDIELSGQAVSEIWPAAVRLAGDDDKDSGSTGGTRQPAPAEAAPLSK